MLFDKDTKLAFRSESKGVGDLKSKTMFELNELLDRQNHLLGIKSLMMKLKDKGDKVRKTRDEILNELKLRNAATSEATIKNNSACEWRDSKNNEETLDDSIEIDDTNILKILATNKVTTDKTCKSHNQRLIDKEIDPKFIYRPSNAVVSQKIKKLFPEAHTGVLTESCIKTIHLDESLDLLTEQISALKIYGKKRAEQVIDDRINESTSFGEDLDEDEDNDQGTELLP